MDIKKALLFAALGFVLLQIWQEWQKDFGPKPNTPISSSAPASALPVEGQPAMATGDVPSSPANQGAAGTAVPATTSEAAPKQDLLDKGQRIEVVTDLVRAEIDTVGGDLRQLALLNYPVAAKTPQEPFHLLNDTLPEVFVAQSGLLANLSSPDHHAVFTAEQAQYQLPENSKELSVRLHWVSPEGVKVVKIYTFQRGSYEIKLDYQIENATAQDWKGHLYSQFQRVVDESKNSRFIYTYTGAVLSSPENKYEKIKFDSLEKQVVSRDFKEGWVAVLQHYFVGAWIPAREQTNHYYTKALGEKRYLVGVSTPEVTVPAGQMGTLSTRLYAGPKLQDHLAEVAPGLELTVDYGYLTVLAEPLFWLLKHIHGLIGNWGWSIVILTFLIKLVFYKLSAASYKSMANMRRLQPRIASLKERFGEDRQRMSQALMEMYKTEKINPLGGCLPVVVQIPVFIALYWVLLESIELRQADFVLWINDLSSPDPYYILPLLMGVTMLIQQMLSPAPPDPLQAKVMKILPVAFTFFFAFFPAGLVLYWVANNTLSITQQWYITRQIEAAAGSK